MKPQGCVALPKEIRNALTETQISALNGLAAAAALGAAACSGFKRVGHAGRILGGRQGANRGSIWANTALRSLSATARFAIDRWNRLATPKTRERRLSQCGRRPVARDRRTAEFLGLGARRVVSTASQDSALAACS